MTARFRALPVAMVIILGGIAIAAATVVIPRLRNNEQSGVQTITVAAGNPTVTAATQDDRFATAFVPFMRRYCMDCHGADNPDSGISLDKLLLPHAIVTDRAGYERVLRMLTAGAMPPPDFDPLPTEDDRQAVLRYLDDTLYHFDCNLVDDPGRPTIRRLNRAEYANTIRDLVGIDFNPAKDFPSDDVGYGFDNIGDVLSLPPLLMEKYLDAAELIASTAIDGIDYSKPLVIAHRQGEALEQEGAVNDGGDGFKVMSSIGLVAAPFTAPVGGDYLLRAEARADQAGSEPAKMEFRIDGRTVKTFDIAEHQKPRIHEFRLRLEAGSRRFEAAFINDFYEPKAKNRNRRDRNLHVRFLEIEGPFNPDAAVYSDTHRAIVTVAPSAELSVRQAAGQILRPFVSRAWRRSITDGEIEPLVRLIEHAVAEDHDTWEQAVQLAVQATLVSPHFLFRVEADPDPNDPNAKHDVGDFELASRLSYFLWSSMPDAELVGLAERNELHEPHVLEQEVQRMLQDPKSTALVNQFARQWLNLGLLSEVTPDPDQFPEFTPELRADMQQETELLFQSVMQNDRSILEFLNADYTFVNARLAKHYGLPDFAGEEFERVSLEDSGRTGVLTHASILSITSNPSRTSPVKRGKWIMENILGTEPPPPPPGVPDLDETGKANPNASIREQLEQHRADPACASCHRTMDVLGFGFENFDAIGRWRDTDGAAAIDPSGQLPTGEAFAGPSELIAILARRRDEFARSMAEKMLTYALGRGLEYYDRCAIDDVVDALRAGDYRFSVLVTQIAKSDPFTRRRGEELTN